MSAHENGPKSWPLKEGHNFMLSITTEQLAEDWGSLLSRRLALHRERHREEESRINAIINELIRRTKEIREL